MRYDRLAAAWLLGWIMVASAFGQGVIIERNDGRRTVIPASELKSITTYTAEEAPWVESEETVLVMLPWAGELSEALLENLNTMKKQIADSRGALLTGRRLLVFRSESPNRSRLMEVRYQDGRCVSDTLAAYTTYLSNYTTVEGLCTLLEDVKRASSTPRYSMITGCHGTGWTPKGVDPRYAPRRAYGVAFGEDDYYQTDISDLAEALKRSGLRMEYVVFDDCYMAQMEIAYELKDVAGYLIGSVCEEMGDGIPYADCLAPLLAHDFDTFTRRFGDFYSEFNGMMSVIDCSKADEMASLFRRANADYALDASMTGSLQRFDGFSVPAFFDMADYARALCRNDSGLLGQIETVLGEMVCWQVFSPRYVSSIDGGVHAVGACSGITVSDPTENVHLLEHKTNTAWWKATHSSR